MQISHLQFVCLFILVAASVLSVLSSTVPVLGGSVGNVICLSDP